MNYTLSLLFIIFSLSMADESLHLVATITGKQSGEKLGHICNAGDVNNDGFDDFLIASSLEVKLYLGGAMIDTLSDLVFQGTMCSAAGDVNNDGFDDILVGDPNYDEGKGVAHLYFGGVYIDTIPDFQFNGKYYRHGMGAGLAAAGDMNKDNYGDFIIGAPYNEFDEYGRAYLFMGGDSISDAPFIVLKSETKIDFFGANIIRLNDINSDSIPDIAISSQEMNLSIPGCISIFYGGQNMDCTADSIIHIQESDEISDRYNLVNAGDVNCDGSEDILISGGYYSSLYLGSGIKIHYKGESVGGGGDINGDGFNDFLIGDGNYVNNDNVMVGAVSVFLGSEIVPIVSDQILTGETKWGQFGIYSAILGDLNGDGYDEVAIAAPSYPDHELRTGKIYIYSHVLIDRVESNNHQVDNSTIKCFPNPFNHNTSILINLKKPTRAGLCIYNLSGRKVTTLIDNYLSAGDHCVVWNGNNSNSLKVASGIYFVVLSNPEQNAFVSALSKLIVIK